MSESPVLDITYLVDEQNQAEVKVNELINRLEVIAALKILDRDLTAPPGTPSNGDVYIPAATATGAWAGEEGNLAIYYDGWTFLSPYGGMKAFVHDEKIWIGYSSQESEWHPLQRTFSTTAYWTGEYYGANKVYEKTIDFGSLPDTTTKSVAHGLTTPTIIEVNFMADDGTDQIDISGTWSDGSNIAYTKIDDTNVKVTTTWNAGTAGYSGIVTMRYY